MKASSYFNCSSSCDFIAINGGKFYGSISEGCQHVIKESICGFCGKIIGSKNNNLLNDSTAKIFKPN